MSYRQILTALTLGAGLTAPGVLAGEPGTDAAAFDGATQMQAGRSSAPARCGRAASSVMVGSPVSVRRLLGIRVTNPINEEIGKVSDLIIDRCGRIKTLIVHVGGFFGIGGRYARISLDKVRVQSRAGSAAIIVLVRETRDHILSGGTLSQGGGE